MVHPLTPVINQLDPDRIYTTADLMRLTRLHKSSVQSLIQGGWLPGGETRPHRRGGRKWVWTGAALLAATRVPEADLPELDHTRYSPVTLYRLGCGCPDCTAAHNASTQAWKRAQTEKAFPARVRARVLARVAGGEHVADAARAEGVTPGQVWGYYRLEPAFAAALDEAGEALCEDSTDYRCGSARGYGALRCRGTGCRVAKRAGR